MELLCYTAAVTSVLLFLSACFAVISPVTYIVSIVRGKSKPHRITRFILLFVLTLNFVSIIAAHGNTGAKLFASITFLQALIIFILCLWRGMGGSSKFDWACLIVAFSGIIGWKITGNAITGIWFSVLADFAAYMPAFIKTWKQPDTESSWYYFTAALASFLSIVAYKINAASIFQLYIIFCSIVMLVCINHRNMKLSGMHVS